MGETGFSRLAKELNNFASVSHLVEAIIIITKYLDIIQLLIRMVQWKKLFGMDGG